MIPFDEDCEDCRSEWGGSFRASGLRKILRKIIALIANMTSKEKMERE